jgi:hypothetical protein
MRVPHIWPVFGQMWELTNADAKVPVVPEKYRSESRLIFTSSQKQGKMWTPDLCGKPVFLSLRLRGESLHPGMQPALIPGSSILMQNTLLHTLVERGDGLVVLLSDSRGIPFGNGLAEGAKGLADLTLVGPVHCGTLNCLTGALQRRHMVCHLKPLAFYKLDAG